MLEIQQPPPPVPSIFENPELIEDKTNLETQLILKMLCFPIKVGG